MPDGIYCNPTASVTNGVAITRIPPTSAVTTASPPFQPGLPISPATISSKGNPKAARNAPSVSGGKCCTASAIRNGAAPKDAAVSTNRAVP